MFSAGTTVSPITENDLTDQGDRVSKAAPMFSHSILVRKDIVRQNTRSIRVGSFSATLRLIYPCIEAGCS